MTLVSERGLLVGGRGEDGSLGEALMSALLRKEADLWAFLPDPPGATCPITHHGQLVAQLVGRIARSAGSAYQELSCEREIDRVVRLHSKAGLPPIAAAAKAAFTGALVRRVRDAGQPDAAQLSVWRKLGDYLMARLSHAEAPLEVGEAVV